MNSSRILCAASFLLVFLLASYFVALGPTTFYSSPVEKTVISTKNHTSERARIFREGSKSRKLPVKSFQYYRLHKTGSKRTQVILQRYCRVNKLKCLDFDTCGGLKRLRSCWGNGNLDKSDPLVWVTDATFTYSRIQNCCPKALQTKYHGVQEHVWLRDKKMHKFLAKSNVKENGEKPFRFTILRNPVDQLISYFEYISRHTHRFYAAMKQATKDIEIKGEKDEYAGLADFLLKITENPQYSTDQALLNLTDLITNSQAKELGWNGTKEDLQRISDFLETLDFVGVFEELSEIHERVLPEKLGWDHDRFFTDNIITKHYFCTTRTKQYLRTVQYADMKLYSKARKLYFRDRRKQKCS